MPVSASPAKRRRRPPGAARGRRLLPGRCLPTNRRVVLPALTVLAVDQATKWFALEVLSRVPTVPVFPGLFHLTFVLNSGVAFGFFQGHGLWITLGTLVILALLFRTTLRLDRGKWVPVCLGLILGGAVGNLVDRLRFGAVVDFLDFRVWPVFNLADSCITVGAALLAVSLWRKG